MIYSKTQLDHFDKIVDYMQAVEERDRAYSESDYKKVKELSASVDHFIEEIDYSLSSTKEGYRFDFHKEGIKPMLVEIYDNNKARIIDFYTDAVSRIGIPKLGSVSYEDEKDSVKVGFNHILRAIDNITSYGDTINGQRLLMIDSLYVPERMLYSSLDTSIIKDFFAMQLKLAKDTVEEAIEEA